MEKNDAINKDLILRERLAIQRTHLANQATFLAFLRSSMYFLVAGLTVKSLSGHQQSDFFEILLFVISAILILTGLINYFSNKKKIAASEVHIGSYKDDFTKE